MKLAPDSAKTADRIVPRLYVTLPATGAAATSLPEDRIPIQRPLVADLVSRARKPAGMDGEEGSWPQSR